MADPDLDVTPEPKRVTRLIRPWEVQQRVGLGRSSIYPWMAQGKFPMPLQLGGCAVAWAKDEIQNWIASRLQRLTNVDRSGAIPMAMIGTSFSCSRFAAGVRP